MKLKDIEKNLKREQDSGNIPDVYASAKKAPLNKLLTGETPIRAFKKQLALRLLITALLLFAVSAICIGALWLTKPPTVTVPDCRVTVTVERESGESLTYTLHIRNNYEIFDVLKEEDGKYERLSGLSVADFMTPIDGDKLVVAASCEDKGRAAKIKRAVIEDLKEAYKDVSYELG